MRSVSLNEKPPLDSNGWRRSRPVCGPRSDKRIAALPTASGKESVNAKDVLLKRSLSVLCGRSLSANTNLAVPAVFRGASRPKSDIATRIDRVDRRPRWSWELLCLYCRQSACAGWSRSPAEQLWRVGTKEPEFRSGIHQMGRRRIRSAGACLAMIGSWHRPR